MGRCVTIQYTIFSTPMSDGAFADSGFSPGGSAADSFAEPIQVQARNELDRLYVGLTNPIRRPNHVDVSLATAQLNRLALEIDWGFEFDI